MVCFSKNVKENMYMFTYELLGMPTESGIHRVLNRSMTSETDLKIVIAQAKSLLRSQIAFPAGEPYAIRVFDNASILVWTANINDV